MDSEREKKKGEDRVQRLPFGWSPGKELRGKGECWSLNVEGRNGKAEKKLREERGGKVRYCLFGYKRDDMCAPEKESNVNMAIWKEEEGEERDRVHEERGGFSRGKEDVMCTTAAPWRRVGSHSESKHVWRKNEDPPLLLHTD